MDSSAVSARLIGAIFVEKGLITEEQLELALEEQRTSGERLGEILVEKFGVERLDLASALAEQWAEYERGGAVEDGETTPVAPSIPLAPVAAPAGGVLKRPIGEIFVERGLVTEKQLEEALEEQRKSGRRLGEILVATGKLSRLELASALADQWATFQKLRPPDEPAAPAAERVKPTPEVVAPPSAANGAVASELAARIEELWTRVEELSDARDPGDTGLETAIAARLDQLEQALAAHEPRDLDELRARLGEIESTVAAAAASAPGAAAAVRSELGVVTDRLRERIEEIEAHVGRADASDAVVELRSELAAVRERLDALGDSAGDWRNAVADLSARLDALPSPPDCVAELGLRVEAVASEVESWRGELAAQVQALRDEQPSIAEEPVAELGARLEVVASRLQEWREPLGELAAQVQALREEKPSIAEEPVAELGARLEVVASRLQEWRGPLGELAAQVQALREEQPAVAADAVAGLQERLDRLEQSLSGGDDARALDELRGQLETIGGRVAEAGDTAARVDELAQAVERLGAASAERQRELAELVSRIDSLPVPSEEWREHVAALAARLDAIPDERDEWRGEAEAIHARIAALAVPDEGWRDAVDAVVARLDALRVDEWRPALDGLAEEIRGRLARLEERPVASASDGELHELRARLDAGLDDAGRRVGELEACIAALAVPDEGWRDAVDAVVARLDGLRVDEWRPALDGLAEEIRGRLARLEERPVASASDGELHELRARLDAGLDDAGRRVGELEACIAGLADATGDPTLEPRLDDLSARIEQEAAAREALRHELEARVGDPLEGLQHAHAAQEQRLDELASRLDELAETGRHGVPDDRIAALEWGLGELRAGLDAATHPLDERLAAVEERTAAISMHSAQEIELLRRELGELRGALTAAGDSAATRVEDMLGTLRHELSATLEQAASKDELRELTEALGERDARLEELASGLGGIEHRLDEKAAARTAELGALRARVESVEGALGRRQIDADALEQRLSDQEERLEELAARDVRKKEIREVARAVERLEQRVEARESIDEAATRAVEKAVRKGLASLGDRITAAEDAYAEAGRALQDSIAGLGRAIAGADAHIAAGGQEPEPTGSTYVAFAPTSEGYRLVVCEGAAPELGEKIEIEAYEGELVVTRCGSSPLPFDARRCVYLERA